tara:strand:+ start:90 stop:389 length:300 start_codon:yes stop_codon:yes gene_type:complete
MISENTRVINLEIVIWDIHLSKAHQNDCALAKQGFGILYLVFVCYLDGICCVEFDDFKYALDHVHEDSEWVSIRRKKGEKDNKGERWRTQGENRRFRFS